MSGRRSVCVQRWCCTFWCLSCSFYFLGHIPSWGLTFRCTGSSCRLNGMVDVARFMRATLRSSNLLYYFPVWCEAESFGCWRVWFSSSRSYFMFSWIRTAPALGLGSWITSGSRSFSLWFVWRSASVVFCLRRPWLSDIRTLNGCWSTPPVNKRRRTRFGAFVETFVPHWWSIAISYVAISRILCVLSTRDRAAWSRLLPPFGLFWLRMVLFVWVIIASWTSSLLPWFCLAFIMFIPIGLLMASTVFARLRFVWILATVR